MTRKFLADTHVLLWFEEAPPMLPPGVLSAIRNPDNEILVSQISLFELAIKMRIGKLQLRNGGTLEEFSEALQADNFRFLPLNNEHIFAYQQVPLFPDHRDPFDRLLIATAMAEQATILTADSHFSLYAAHVAVLW
jgi:PIN domain nuclease of toxin-antitoxin system